MKNKGAILKPAPVKLQWPANFRLKSITPEIWIAGDDFPTLIEDLFIGYSAPDLICFSTIELRKPNRKPDRMAYAAVGLLPNFQQIQYLKKRFPFARFHTVFDNDLLGKLADTSIAAWYKGHHPFFRFTAKGLLVRYRNKLFVFNVVTYSLNAFEKATGLRSGIRTHKPPKGATSFKIIYR